MKLVIIGAGSNARETLDVVEARRQAGIDDLDLLGFLVERRFAEPGTPALGSTILGDLDWLEGRPLDDTVGFCAVGSAAVRRRLVSRACGYGLRFVTMVHPSVAVSDRDRIGPGTLVQRGALLTSGARLGAFVHVYAGCLLSHGVSIGDYATLSPGVKIGGDVRVAEGATLGIGANVIHRRTVGPWSIVGAGATVIADVPADSTVVGVPARVIERRTQGWHLHPPGDGQVLRTRMLDDREAILHPLCVSRPVLPPLEEFTELLRPVWASHRLSNGGSLHAQLEERLRACLGVPHLSLTVNGTMSLLLACRALRLSGEVITTPFTFAATPHVLSWSGLEPVFCDIDPSDLGLLPAAVEAAITPRTSAVLAVHAYGIPSRLAEIADITRRHGLALIYDAAHAFGVEVGGRAIGTFGDATMFSFHTTKLFHTGEGGALVCRDPVHQDRANAMRNFGIVGDEPVQEPGLNGKMNELQAALGLAVLSRFEAEWAHRDTLARAFRRELDGVPGITIPAWPRDVRPSHTFFPISVEADAFGCSRDALHEWLCSRNVVTKRYFFPLCSDFPCYRDLPSSAPGHLPQARLAATRFLCLPLHSGVTVGQAAEIADLVRRAPVRVG